MYCCVSTMQQKTQRKTLDRSNIYHVTEQLQQQQLYADDDALASASRTNGQNCRMCESAYRVACLAHWLETRRQKRLSPKPKHAYKSLRSGDKSIKMIKMSRIGPIKWNCIFINIMRSTQNITYMTSIIGYNMIGYHTLRRIISSLSWTDPVA